jgi:hypothetical protein
VQILGMFIDWCCVASSCIMNVTPEMCFNLTSLLLGKYIYKIAAVYLLFNVLKLGYN